MKKRISLLVTLALTAFIATGCDGIAGFLQKKSETPTEQEDQNQPEIPENTNFTVTFNANGGSGSMTSDVTDGSSYYVTRACEFTYTGRSFVAWALNSVQGPRYELGDMIYDIADNITLYAIWETINYRVTFNANGGTGTMQPDTTEGSSYYVTRACEFEYDGHTFEIWALNSPNGIHYDLGDTIYNIDRDIVLYAVWEEIPVPNYTVSFNANGGSGTMVNKTTSGSSYTTPVCTFTFSNHTFDKWALDSTTGAKYSEGETIENISKDITLFATWIEDEVPQTNYMVTFDANGGSGTMEGQQTSGSNFIVPECAFTRESYTFKNWAYETKNGVEYSPGETIKNIEKDITLYALWTEQAPIDPENPDIPAGYYSQCEGLTGSALQAKLKSINPAKNPSYDWSRYEDADEAEDDSTSILCIYTRHNIKKSSHCGSYAWDRWNREHIWTQSKFPASDSDNHNIFACEGQINNYRGNKPYAEGGSVVVVFGHTTGCKQTSDTFEPCDEAKGEVARSVMYGTVMYSYTMTQEIESIELALKWHLQHEITTRETKRNNVVYGNQGNRNPFVDHPEYACRIWGTTNSATRALCGM